MRDPVISRHIETLAPSHISILKMQGWPLKAETSKVSSLPCGQGRRHTL